MAVPSLRLFPNCKPKPRPAGPDAPTRSRIRGPGVTIFVTTRFRCLRQIMHISSLENAEHRKGRGWISAEGRIFRLMKTRAEGTTGFRKMMVPSESLGRPLKVY